MKENYLGGAGGKMSYEVVKMNDDTWRIEDGGVRFFLLIGTKEALLIDSGMQVKNAKEIAMGITKLPVKLLNTHADTDHIGSNGEFQTFYMHAAESSNYYNTHNHTGDFTPVEDGEVLDLGDRPLEIILIPGHTPGSIAVLDVKNRVLFSGDSVQDGTVYMFGIQREIHAYRKSLDKLEQYQERFDWIYPSHSSIPIKPQIIPEIKHAVDSIMAGKIESTEVDLWGHKVKKYTTPAISFYME